MEVGQIIPNVILAQIQPAKNHVDEATGFQEYVDLKSLQLWRDTITEDFPVNLDHDFSLLSELVPVCGMITKDSIKIVGDKLMGDFVIAKEAFTEAMYFVGNIINDLLAKGKDEIMFSLQGIMGLEQDAEKRLSLIRPTETDKASLVRDGAATTQLVLNSNRAIFLSAKQNPGIKQKLDEIKINNNNKTGEAKMSADKKDEKPSMDDVKEKVDAAHADVKDVKDTVKKLDADNAWQDEFMSSLKDLHAKVDNLCAMSSKVVEPAAKELAAKPEVIEVAKDEPKVNKTIEVKLSADIGNMSETPANDEKAVEITDEELEKNWKKYYLSKDLKIQNRIQKLARKNGVRKDK